MDTGDNNKIFKNLVKLPTRILDFTKRYAKHIPKKDRFHFGVIAFIVVLTLVAMFSVKDQKWIIVIIALLVILGVCILKYLEQKKKETRIKDITEQKKKQKPKYMG